MDTGADTSQFSFRILARLRVEISADEKRHSVVGVGGRSDAVLVDAKLIFETTGGGTVTVNGPYLGCTDPTALDVSYLGRDVLANFDVILSRRQNHVLLLAGNHGYTVTG